MHLGTEKIILQGLDTVPATVDALILNLYASIQHNFSELADNVIQEFRKL